MRSRPRNGVSGYLEVFILAAVAVGGSALVFGAATAYTGSLAGASVGILSASISQGTYSAIESVTVADTGSGSIGSFVVTTSQAPGTAAYCYSVEAPENGTVLATSCPSMAEGPGSVNVGVSVRPGGSVTLELLVMGEYALGSGHLVIVTASSGAEASVEAQVVPG